MKGRKYFCNVVRNMKGERGVKEISVPVKPVMWNRLIPEKKQDEWEDENLSFSFQYYRNDILWGMLSSTEPQHYELRRCMQQKHLTQNNTLHENNTKNTAWATLQRLHLITGLDLFTRVECCEITAKIKCQMLQIPPEDISPHHFKEKLNIKYIYVCICVFFAIVGLKDLDEAPRFINWNWIEQATHIPVACCVHLLLLL